MHTNNNFMGHSGFYHFFGIVEDRNDPMKLGRLRVRCFGIHTDNLQDLPTSDLPWAQVVHAVTDGAQAIPNVWENDMVFGFFADGIDLQVPIILGVVSTNKGGGNPLKGFSDHRSASVVNVPGGSTVPYSARSSTPGVNFLATSTGYGTSYVGVAKKPTTGIKQPGYKTVSEPNNPYAAKYPYNHANATESGHVIEFDDTPGAERINIMHRSGSFVELHPDGKIIIKSKADMWSVSEGNETRYTKGNLATTNDGTFNHLSAGAYTLEVAGGNMTVDVKSGGLNLTVNGNVNQTVNGNMKTDVAGSYDVNASIINMKAGAINLN